MLDVESQEGTHWDIFISHASEDKDTFVDPLAKCLRQHEVRVWYDRFVLLPGDRLSEKIGQGLRKSRYGLLVISRSFIDKKWTRFELSALMNQSIIDGTRLIPIWLGVGRDDVADLNPALADLLSIPADKDSIDTCAREILRVVRPQLYKNLNELGQIALTQFRHARVRSESIRLGPVRHHDLPETLLIRIRNIWFATHDVVSGSLEETIEQFQRDLKPEQEIEVWERMISAANIAMGIVGANDESTQKQIYQVLLWLSTGDADWLRKGIKTGKLTKAVTKATLRGWQQAAPPITVSKVEDA